MGGRSSSSSSSRSSRRSNCRRPFGSLLARGIGIVHGDGGKQEESSSNRRRRRGRRALDEFFFRTKEMKGLIKKSSLPSKQNLDLEFFLSFSLFAAPSRARAAPSLSPFTQFRQAALDVCNALGRDRPRLQKKGWKRCSQQQRTNKRRRRSSFSQQPTPSLQRSKRRRRARP